MSGIDYLKFKQLIHSDDLYHHGIKGQKWGVRKKVYEQDYERMTPDEKSKYMDDREKQAKKNSRKVRLMLAAGAIITYALIRQYKNNHAKATTEAVEEKAKEVAKEKVKEQAKEKVKEQVKEQAKEKVKEQAKAQVTNSAVNVGQSAVNRILTDGSDIVRIPSMAIRGDRVKPFMFLHSLDNQDEHLEHFGILGQKWGVRRFQNEDGTLTPEGKARYYKEIVNNNNTNTISKIINENPDVKRKFVSSLRKYDDYNKASKELCEKLDKKLDDIAYDDKYNYEKLPPYDDDPVLWENTERKWATDIYNKYLEIAKNSDLKKLYDDYNRTNKECMDSMDALCESMIGKNNMQRMNSDSLLKFYDNIRAYQEKILGSLTQGKYDSIEDIPSIDYVPYEKAKEYDPLRFVQAFTCYQFVD